MAEGSISAEGLQQALRAEVMIDGPAATAPGLALAAPISFWGGVDPKTGSIVDVRHPQRDVSIAGTVLMLPATIGSSSASAVLLELIHKGLAPAAIIMHEADAILLLGVLVAREMGWPHPAAFKLDASHYPSLDGKLLHAS